MYGALTLLSAFVIVSLAIAKPKRNAAEPTALDAVFKMIRLSYFSTSSKSDSFQKSIYASSSTTIELTLVISFRISSLDAPEPVGLQGLEKIIKAAFSSLAFLITSSTLNVKSSFLSAITTL